MRNPFQRPPDRIIKGDDDAGDYLHRWYLIPKNEYFNIYLHQFNRSDDDRALHDHPWFSLSFLLSGEVREHQYEKVRYVLRFFPVFRSAKFAHRIEVVKGPVRTIFITGPVWRKWGFYTDDGWLQSDDFFEKYGVQK